MRAIDSQVRSYHLFVMVDKKRSLKEDTSSPEKIERVSPNDFDKEVSKIKI